VVNLKVPQVHIGLLVVLPLVMKSCILRVKFLEIQLELLSASLSSVCASSVVLLAISHQLFDGFDLAGVLVALVLDGKGLLNKLIILVTKAFHFPLVLLQDLIDPNLEEFLKRSAFLWGRFDLYVGLL